MTVPVAPLFLFLLLRPLPVPLADASDLGRRVSEGETLGVMTEVECFVMEVRLGLCWVTRVKSHPRHVSWQNQYSE